MSAPTNRLDNPRAWLERERELATIERVTNILCPPEPVHDDHLDAASYAMRHLFGLSVKRPSDFGVIAINSVV